MFKLETTGDYLIAGFYVLAFSIVPIVILLFLVGEIVRWIHRKVYGPSTHTGYYDSEEDRWYKSGKPSPSRVMEDERIFNQLRSEVRAQNHPTREAYAAAMQKAVRNNMNWVIDGNGNKTYPEPSMFDNNSSVTELFDVDPKQIR